MSDPVRQKQVCSHASPPKEPGGPTMGPHIKDPSFSRGFLSGRCQPRWGGQQKAAKCVKKASKNSPFARKMPGKAIKSARNARKRPQNRPFRAEKG